MSHHRADALSTRLATAFVTLALTALVVAHVLGQAAATLTLVSANGRRTVPITASGGQDLVSLDDLASAFQVMAREEAGAITVSYKGKTIVLTPDQPLVSVAGRLVSLPSAPTKTGGHWMVPTDFIGRALALIYDTRLDLRRASRLVVIGELRVPRVTVREEPLGSSTRLTIDATPRAAGTVTQDGQRLTIAFDADGLDLALPAVTADGLITALRAGETSVTVDLGPRFQSFKSTSQSIDTTGRLVVDVLSAQAAQAPTAPATPPARPAAPAAAEPQNEPAGTAGALLIRTIAVDPGHGGDDTGAKGPGGALEKDLTLAVARAVKTAIEGRLGIRVVLTRDDDHAVPVDGRSAIANANKADLFVSLHANASFRPSSSGASVFIASFDGPDATRGMPAPERLPVTGGGVRDVELMPWNLAQMRFVKRSAGAAELLRQQLDGHVPLDRMTVAAAPLRVLEAANMPAVLVEMGYLTNPDQERQLTSAETQTAFVQAIVDTVLKFREALAAGSFE